MKLLMRLYDEKQTSLSNTVCVVTCKSDQLRTFQTSVVLKAAKIGSYKSVKYPSRHRTFGLFVLETQLSLCITFLQQLTEIIQHKENTSSVLVSETH